MQLRVRGGSVERGCHPLRAAVRALALLVCPTLHPSVVLRWCCHARGWAQHSVVLPPRFSHLQHLDQRGSGRDGHSRCNCGPRLHPLLLSLSLSRSTSTVGVGHGTMGYNMRRCSSARWHWTEPGNVSGGWVVIGGRAATPSTVVRLSTLTRFGMTPIQQGAKKELRGSI